MKLRNKKTGEIMGLSMAGDIVWVGNYRYKSLAELNEEWEDYDEQSEKEAIAMLEQISEAIDRINANIARICGKGKK